MKRAFKYFVVLFLLVTLGPAFVVAQRGGGAAQTADNGPFGALRWRSLGPPRGGRSLAVAGSVARPYEYYMGATGGGLWKTTDGGVTWPAVTAGQIHSPPRGAVPRSPPKPGVVLHATGEAAVRRHIDR